MKKLLFYLLASLLGSAAFAQELSLQECQQLARQNHPLLKQAGVIDEMYSLRIKSVRSANLPQLDLSGRASYQSEVTSISIPMLGINNEQSKDQYKVLLDIKQKLYDFGMTKNRKNIEIADRNVAYQQNELDLYKLKETVNSLYFGILAAQENNSILSYKKEILLERQKIVGSAVKNGMSLPNELDNLQAEALLTDQQQVELSMNKQTSLDLLGILIGKELNENALLLKPIAAEADTDSKLIRPEIRLFELQKEKINRNEIMLKSSHMPYLYAFGQGGYGRPGLNMLTNDFDSWYMVGLGFSWNLWDGNKTKNDRAALRTQKKSIDISRENFERNIKLSLTQEKNNVQKLEILLISDQELLKLKEKIAKRSQSALDNGTITSADYIRDLNAALQAKNSLNIHQLQLIQAKINYQTILGN